MKQKSLEQIALLLQATLIAQRNTQALERRRTAQEPEPDLLDDILPVGLGLALDAVLSGSSPISDNVFTGGGGVSAGGGADDLW